MIIDADRNHFREMFLFAERVRRFVSSFCFLILGNRKKKLILEMNDK